MNVRGPVSCYITVDLKVHALLGKEPMHNNCDNYKTSDSNECEKNVMCSKLSKRPHKTKLAPL